MLFSIDFDEPLPGAFKAKWCNLVESILLNTELVSILIPVCYVNLPFTFFKYSENFFSFDASHKTIVQWISEDVQYQQIIMSI